MWNGRAGRDCSAEPESHRERGAESLDARGGSVDWEADKPAKRIDYILSRRTDRIRSKKAWTVNTLASDHVPVVADLEIGKQSISSGQ